MHPEPDLRMDEQRQNAQQDPLDRDRVDDAADPAHAEGTKLSARPRINKRIENGTIDSPHQQDDAKRRQQAGREQQHGDVRHPQAGHRRFHDADRHRDHQHRGDEDGPVEPA